MKAAILAAGKGTRMRELTNEVPKPMLRMQGKPILEHIVSGLLGAGIRDFFIVTGKPALPPSLAGSLRQGTGPPETTLLKGVQGWSSPFNPTNLICHHTSSPARTESVMAGRSEDESVPSAVQFGA
jgi:hypothetical protein